MSKIGEVKLRGEVTKVANPVAGDSLGGAPDCGILFIFRNQIVV